MILFKVVYYSLLLFNFIISDIDMTVYHNLPKSDKGKTRPNDLFKLSRQLIKQSLSINNQGKKCQENRKEKKPCNICKR